MKRIIVFCVALFVSTVSYGQLDTESWPPNTDFSQEIHYWTADGFLELPANASNLSVENLAILTGGDQVTEDVVVAGQPAKRSISTYMNIADDLSFIWIDYFEIDILVQYFADQRSVRNNSFLVGSLPGSNLKTVPTVYDRVTDQYEWRLFRIDNSDGKFGFVFDESIGGSTYGGVNGGTVRIEQSTNLVIRAIAIAPGGTFGEPDDINLPPTSNEFNPDDHNHIAVWDINNNVVDGLDLHRETGGDQESVVVESAGPAGSQRRAVRAAFDQGTDGTQDIYLNWVILDEHFGPTSQPATSIKVCASYYDDPALAGQTFGPEAYRGPGNDILFFPAERRKTLEGTGRWRETSWIVDNVKFNGINVPTQASTRFVFSAPILISSVRIGVYRASGSQAGIEPIPECTDFDPDPFQNYAQWDPTNGIEEGITMGPNGGDQEWVIEDNIGPANDKRSAVRPLLDQGTDSNYDRFMNWAILDEWFGPTSQPNAVFKVCVDYYDDPALAGFVFGPEVYQTSVGGVPQLKFYPAAQRQTLEGTGTWRKQSWIISDVNFTGVNVGPQGAVRFAFQDGAAVYISRVQYGIIRPVGQSAGVDPLAGCGDATTIINDWSILE